MVCMLLWHVEFSVRVSSAVVMRHLKLDKKYRIAGYFRGGGGGGGARGAQHQPCGDFSVYCRGWSSAFMHAHASAWLPLALQWTAVYTLQCKRWPALA